MRNLYFVTVPKKLVFGLMTKNNPPQQPSIFLSPTGHSFPLFLTVYLQI